MDRKFFIKIVGLATLGSLLNSCRKYTFESTMIQETITRDLTQKLYNMANETENVRNSSRTGSTTTISNGFNGCETVEDISTTRVKSTFDAVRLSGKSTYQIEVGMLVSIGDLVLQAGYRKAGSKTIPFTDYSYKTPVTINILNGGTAPFTLNAKNTFEVYKYATATYRYRRNGVDVLEFVLQSDLDITYANVHTLTIGGGSIPTVNFYPAIQYDSGGNYIHAISGKNVYGASNVGFEGNIQNNSLQDNELNAGSNIAKTGYGVTLWS